MSEESSQLLRVLTDEWPCGHEHPINIKFVRQALDRLELKWAFVQTVVGLYLEKSTLLLATPITQGEIKQYTAAEVFKQACEIAKEQHYSPNLGNLENMACPECGCFGPFTIQVEVSASVSDQAVVVRNCDQEWKEHSYCRCQHCSHAGIVTTFTLKHEQPTPAPASNPSP